MEKGYLEKGYLEKDQIEYFQSNGFLVINSFLSTNEVKALKDRIRHIIEDLDLTTNRSVFTTVEQTRTSDDYFLDSGDKICYFWESDSWNDCGELVQPREQCINKIGHNLHDIDDEFKRVSYDQRIGAICKDLGIKIPLAVQSMYIFKQPHIGGVVSPHQDGAFLYTDPQSCLGFWWALDDCSLENGCLWAVPGSHKLGVERRFRRKDPPEPGTEFVPSAPVQWDLSNAVSLEVPAGSLVLLHHALVHYSDANKSSKARHAYSIHIVDGAPGFVYPTDNWLQRPPSTPFNVVPSF